MNDDTFAEYAKEPYCRRKGVCEEFHPGKPCEDQETKPLIDTKKIEPNYALWFTGLSLVYLICWFESVWIGLLATLILIALGIGYLRFTETGKQLLVRIKRI